MMNKKSTKRALLLSALSLLMCVSMLIGSTFAWFTDEVKSGVNKIEAGNLDIELYHGKVEEPATAEVKGATDIFTDKGNAAIVWEPGVVAWTNLNVVNKGTLALKYQLAINFTNENYIKENGAKLSQVLKVAFLDEAVPATAERDDVLKRVEGKGIKLVDLMKSGELLKKDDNKVYGVVIYWEPSADDNNWNVYNGRTTSDGELLHIDLGIALVATQKDAEFDSFGNDYDAGLENSTDGVDRTLNDGSTVRYYSEESGFGGRVRLIALPATVGSEYVVPAEVNDLGGALAGVTLDKLTIHAGIQYAKKSLQGATIGEVVLTEGMTTIPDRLFYQTNIESIVIPDSVTTVEQYAFSQAKVVNLVIPASVETLEEGCFAYMPNLETVVFEGDATLPTYAFRACPKLAKVEIKGDVTVATASMIFSNYESGGKDDMSFYVNSQENAEKLIACLGAYNDTNTGKDRNKWTVYVNEQRFVNVKNATELQKALNNATQDTIISLTADITGDVTVVQKANVKVTIEGNGKTYNGSITIDGKSATILTAGITIRNVNFDATAIANDACIRLGDGTDATRYVANLTVEACTFTGIYPSAEKVGIKTYTGGGANLVVKNCTATKMHSLAQIHNIVNVEFQDCSVVECKNGISVGSSRNAKITNCDVSAVAYGIRCDGGETDSALVIADCDITANIPVVIRKVSKGYALTVNGTNTMTETNTEGLWCVAATNEYGDVNQAGLTAVGAEVTITVNDTALDANGVFIKK